MNSEFDYIVVGSGAGGGPLACNLALAEEGFRVALVEAGGDPCAEPGSRSFVNYSVPALHARASEDRDFAWSFFVDHYGKPDRQREDPKHVAGEGVLYPRGGALGGSTAVHAMITMAPHNSDWEALRTLTGDDSWSAPNMRRYWERLEEWRGGQEGAARTGRRGLHGWLPIETADIGLLAGDAQMLKILVRAFAYGTAAGKGTSALLADAAPAGAKEGSDSAIARQVGTLAQAARRAGSLPTGRATALQGRAKAGYGGLKDRARTVKQLAELYANDEDVRELVRLHLGSLDPNRWFERDEDRVGAFGVPASTLEGVRAGVRERVLAVQGLYPDRLVLLSHSLVTRVVIEKGEAVGVEYLRDEDGRPLYQAAAGAVRARPKPRQLRLRKGGEVILAGGAFNSPQLLMLSGVGPAAHLKQHRIPVRCHLCGVGGNLHDRYEVSLVSQMKKDFPLLRGATFRPPTEPGEADPALKEWYNHRGIYTTSGALACILARSSQAEGKEPDLCLFGLPGYFRGYVPGYSADIQTQPAGKGRWPNHRRFTWAVLKGKTRNRAGQVRLRSADPRQRPSIAFNYFDEGSPGWQRDVAALAEGLRLAGQIMDSTGDVARTLVPDVSLNDREQLEAFIKREAWGHHACGTCKIGKDKDSVLDGDFRVRGVPRLRVVDASVFPDIPGFFLAAPVYMVSEKASDVLLETRRSGRGGAWPKPVT